MKIFKELFYLKYLLEQFGFSHKSTSTIIMWSFPYYYMLIHLFLWVFNLKIFPFFDNKISIILLYLIIPIVICIIITIILFSEKYERGFYREFLYLKFSKKKIIIQSLTFLLLPLIYFGVIILLSANVLHLFI